MDLIGQISTQLGVDSQAAQALAGGVLDTIRGQVNQQLGEQEAQQMEAAIPELEGWRAEAAKLLAEGSAPSAQPGGGDLLGGALGALSSAGGAAGGLAGALGALGGEGATAGLLTQLLPLLGKLELNPKTLQTLAPLVLHFLEDRLPPGLADKIRAVLPLLTGAGAATGSGGGGLGGLLGGLIK